MASQYITSDTPLASWLSVNLNQQPKVNIQVNPVEFTFNVSMKPTGELDNDQLNDLIFQWDSGNAIGNCVTYYKTYRQLVHKLKGE
jgi:hypothetical protein